MKLINNVIQKIDEFPTLPTIYNKLCSVMANPLATAQDVADVIMQDQASAAKILKVVNSPLYGFRGRISSVKQAVVYIGFDEVKNLVIALSVMEIFKGMKKEVAINPVDLWKYSIAVGIVTRHIGVAIGEKNIEDYFISGILHGIGKLLFLKSLPELYSKVLIYAKENNAPTRDVEKQVIGMSQNVAGELLADKWQLPPIIKKCIANQYSGKVDGKVDSLVASVHLAMVVVSLLGWGDNAEIFVPKLNIEIWEKLKIDEGFFTAKLPAFKRDYMESINLLIKTDN